MEPELMKRNQIATDTPLTAEDILNNLKHTIQQQFPNPPQKTRVVVAMSGGVDSSVTAAVMAAAGFDVVGITMQLYDHGAAVGKKGACCAGQDIYDAAQVAQAIGFPHYVLDYESLFRQSVIDDFAEDYLRGETPIPCIRCNQKVKFVDLLKMAHDLGGEALITGHYVQRIQTKDGCQLHRAADSKKDQSYFLFTTTQEQLEFLRFPLGGLPKEHTRLLASHFSLPVADKPDSQDICFVPDGNYASLVAKLRPEALIKGTIVHIDGTILGEHQGIIHFTIGQRKRLGIGGRQEETEPLYVVRLEPETQQVIVGPRSALAQKSIWIQDINWLGSPIPEKGLACEVKIRSSQPPLPAHVFPCASDALKVEMLQPEYGVSPGQACVIYQDQRVLGGGWISRKKIH